MHKIVNLRFFRFNMDPTVLQPFHVSRLRPGLWFLDVDDYDTDNNYCTMIRILIEARITN
jgi:hypothetical protein